MVEFQTASSEAEDRWNSRNRGKREMHNKRPVKGAKEGWGCQKLKDPLRLLGAGLLWPLWFKAVRRCVVQMSGR